MATRQQEREETPVLALLLFRLRSGLLRCVWAQRIRTINPIIMALKYFSPVPHPSEFHGAETKLFQECSRESAQVTVTSLHGHRFDGGIGCPQLLRCEVQTRFSGVLSKPHAGASLEQAARFSIAHVQPKLLAYLVVVPAKTHWSSFDEPFEPFHTKIVFSATHVLS